MSQDTPINNEFDHTDETHRRTFDFQGTPPSQAVIQTLADITGTQVTELPSLYDVVDPESLDTLVLDYGSDSEDLFVEFSFHGYRISIQSSGILEIGPLSELADEESQ